MATDAIRTDVAFVKGSRRRIRVLFDRVLVRRLDAPETFLPGGKIVQTDAHKAEAQEGEVLAVGEGILVPGFGVVPIPVKVGDCVLFGMHSGVKVPLVEGETAFILRAQELMGEADYPEWEGATPPGIRFKDNSSGLGGPAELDAFSVPAAAQGDGDPGSEG